MLEAVEAFGKVGLVTAASVALVTVIDGGLTTLLETVATLTLAAPELDKIKLPLYVPTGVLAAMRTKTGVDEIVPLPAMVAVDA